MSNEPRRVECDMPRAILAICYPCMELFGRFANHNDAKNDRSCDVLIMTTLNNDRKIIDNTFNCKELCYVLSF